MVAKHERFFNVNRISAEDKQTMLSFIHELFNIALDFKNKGEKEGCDD